MKKGICNALLALSLVMVTSCDKEEQTSNLNDLSTTNNEPLVAKGCGTHSSYLKMVEQYPEIAEEASRIEKFTEKTTASLLTKKSTNSTITIPVIVHVVYNTPEQNIKWSQVKSQIDALNRDFNQENDDISNVPNAYKRRIANVGIRFELKRITRTKTDVVEFRDDPSTKKVDEKFNIMVSSEGGKRITDSKKYLNIWVGNIDISFAGFSLRPASSSRLPHLDGVVVDYRHFGTNGTANMYFNKGRTAVHEVGHWLNLIHLSGDGLCDKDDGVSDTPKQSTEYLGSCVSYPETSTCNTPDMTMNFMQSLFDECLFMFTNGQKNRMLSTFEPGGVRETFK